jgi:dienelactone hydrolase
MTPSAPEQAGLTAVEMARAGQFADICDLFAPQLRSLVSADTLQAGWDSEVARLGPITSVGTPVTEPAGPGLTAVKIPVTGENGALTVIVAVTADCWLAGVQLAAASAAGPAEPWQPPPYADPRSFDEQEVTVGSGPLAVLGTLTVPRSAQPAGRPAVVLLPGSGPLDRDSTIGRNKPLKDLAWGLATRGVVVARFDKVAFAHTAQVRQAAEFTVADEYIPDAVAAVTLLASHPAVDPARIFVAGHSLGGTVAPRVAAAVGSVAGTGPSVAGLVILAGGTQPLHWSVVRQISYLASLNPQTAAAAQPVIDAITRQAALVDSPDLSPSTPASELPLGTPAPYWLDLRGYDPVGTAAALNLPLLIVQGGRDYQATVADDLARWQAGLAGRPDVTIMVYEPDNHLFFSGSGPSSPAEYEAAQHVDPAVVADVAGWLLSSRGEDQVR